MRGLALALLAWLASLTAGGVALAQSAATGGPSPSPPGAAVYFVDLKDGATIGPQTTVHFGLRGMGVAPAGSDKPNTGHHHLLIDTDLPPLDQPIPNDFNHLHFGAGQTEADLTLSPGAHTLQLLLGDKNHIPHSPPVMSERIHVTVVETPPPPAAQVAPPPPAAPAAAVTAESPTRRPSPPGAKVFIISPADGAAVPLTLTVRFGIVNMTLARAGVDTPYSGHHHLLIDAPLPPLDQPIPNDENHLHFGAGQTEATITLTPGRHTLQLLLGDFEHMPHDPPVFSAPITVVAGDVAQRKNCRAGEALDSNGECRPRAAAQSTRKPAPRRQAVLPRPGFAPKRARPVAPGEEDFPVAGPAAPQSGEGFNDLRRCQPGTHAESFPSSQGYRCALDR
ncbi:MAG: DUF4399 domain-containing protein [Roseiarcus sp.]